MMSIKRLIQTLMNIHFQKWKEENVEGYDEVIILTGNRSSVRLVNPHI